MMKNSQGIGGTLHLLYLEGEESLFYLEPGHENSQDSIGYESFKYSLRC